MSDFGDSQDFKNQWFCVNGGWKVFYFKEVQVSEEKRLDIVVTYDRWKYVIELKIWRGEGAHKKA